MKQLLLSVSIILFSVCAQAQTSDFPIGARAAGMGNASVALTDIWAVHHGYVSVTPIRLDMTDEVLLKRVQGWEWPSPGR